MRVLLPLLLFVAVHAASRGAWPPSAYTQANATLSLLSTEEKVQLVSGQNLAYKTCNFQRKECSYVGFIEGIPRVGLGPVYLEDGPQGVADKMTGVTQWPSIMTLAQAWRPELAEAMGFAMGAEQVAKGSNVQLGPAVALVRVPWSGRNFEYVSEDPFLNAALAGPMVRGIQRNNISACVKHWIFNSHEVNRHTVSSNVPERAGRELYAPPYRAAVDAGVGCAMCSFNRINGSTYSCAKDSSLQSWLKGDLGFDGFVVSDWGAQHSTLDAVGGLDMEQEWVLNATYFGSNLLAYVNNGSIPLARLDDMAFRVLLPMYALNYASPSPPSAGPNATANTTAHAQLALELAAASLVLLKNQGALLPLPPSSKATVALIGDADLTGGGGSGGVVRPYSTPLLSAVQAELPSATVTYFQGNCSGAAAAARGADLAVVVVSVWASEGMDRANLSLGCPPMAGPQSCLFWPDQDSLIAAVAAVNPNTVVVLRAPGAVVMPWEGSVRGIVNQLYGGQEANAALAGALSGRFNPSGKLTVSFPASMEDTWLSWPAVHGPVSPQSYPGTDRGGGFAEAEYSEGLQVGYRWYDAHEGAAVPPLYAFGWGLSYSHFLYANLSVAPRTLSPATPTAEVRLTLALAQGSPAGREVVQLYVGGALPGDPPKGLKGFSSVALTQDTPLVEVVLTLSLSDLQLWDAPSHAFVPYPPGAYPLWVGSSSADLRLTGSISVQP